MLQPEIWMGASTRFFHQESTEQPTFKKTFRFLRTYGPSSTFREKLLSSVFLIQNLAGMDLENLPFSSSVSALYP